MDFLRGEDSEFSNSQLGFQGDSDHEMKDFSNPTSGKASVSQVSQSVDSTIAPHMATMTRSKTARRQQIPINFMDKAAEASQYGKDSISSVPRGKELQEEKEEGAAT